MIQIFDTRYASLQNTCWVLTPLITGRFCRTIVKRHNPTTPNMEPLVESPHNRTMGNKVGASGFLSIAARFSPFSTDILQIT